MRLKSLLSLRTEPRRKRSTPTSTAAKSLSTTAHIKEEEKERFILTPSGNNGIMSNISKINKKITKMLEKKARLDRKIYKLAQKRDSLKSIE